MTLPEQLRRAGLRPSMARIGVLQVLAAAGPVLAPEEVFHQLLRRGTRTSLGTVYRTVQQLADAGLLQRQWDANRKSRYRLTSNDDQTEVMRVTCQADGVSVEFEHAELHALLVSVAERHGVLLAGRRLEIVATSEPH